MNNKQFYILLLTMLCLGNTARSQEIVMHPMAINGDYDIYGIGLYEKGLFVTSNQNRNTLFEHLDMTGRHSSHVFQIPDTSIHRLNDFTLINQNELNESCLNYSTQHRMYIFTKSIVPTLHSRKTTALGIFILQEINGRNTEIPFPYNAADLEYQTGQGHFDERTQRLYFVSDKPDGQGENDIYYSTYQNGQWQEPIALSSKINSHFDEVFPSITQHGDLIFASKNGASGDFDLHMSRWNGQDFDDPIRLSAPFNSASDDLQLIFTQSNEQGYLVSNRSGQYDQLFAFYQTRPKFIDCQLSEKPIFCYLFEETTIVPNDSLPMLYEWEFSDGTKANGLSVQHCFADLGDYSAMLNVYDSTTKVLYANLSELQLTISRSQLPYIESKSQSQLDTVLTFEAFATEIDSFHVQEIHWNFGDQSYDRGSKVYHQYLAMGNYECQLMFIGTNAMGDTISKCASKQIQVLDPHAPSELITESQNATLSNIDQVAQTIARDSVLYFVEFKQSNIPMPQSDPYFSNIHYEITERKSEQDQLFHYSVGAEKDFVSILPLLQDLKHNGYTSSLIKDQEAASFKISKSQNWWFMPDSIESALNKQMNKFNDIKFETGSWMISRQSFDEIAYIANVMQSQPKISLEIIAHTDSVGTRENNLILSQRRAQSVADYLTTLGISSDRIKTKGMGELHAKGSQGRNTTLADDRRVEFRIIRNQ